jgi:hypothetical protein
MIGAKVGTADTLFCNLRLQKFLCRGHERHLESFMLLSSPLVEGLQIFPICKDGLTNERNE